MVKYNKDNKLVLLEAQCIEKYRYNYDAFSIEVEVDKIRRFLGRIGTYVAGNLAESPGGVDYFEGFDAYHVGTNITMVFDYDVYSIMGPHNHWLDTPQTRKLYKEHSAIREKWEEEIKKKSPHEILSALYENMDMLMVHFNIYLATTKDNDIGWLVDKILKKYHFFKVSRTKQSTEVPRFNVY